MWKDKIKFSGIIVLVFCFQPFLLVKAQEEKEGNEQVQFWASINSTFRLSNKLGLMGA